MTAMNHGEKHLGKVYLAGAGPGDPGLLAVRAAECLRMADLVLYDYLVNPVVLEYAGAKAQRVCLGHHGTGRHVSQDEINARMIAAARQGKTVVRLKAGDPCVFGCLAEEVGALRAAGIPLEIIPGVTAGLAVAGYAEIPVTHGQAASAVALITGHQRRGKAGPSLDYAALAAFPGTLIFYMGVTSAAEWSGALMAGGRSPDTPVAIVRRCTWADQETVRCTLATVAEAIASRQVRPPAIFVVGDVVGLAPATSWFAGRPLFGVCVLVTRPSEQVHELRDRLTALGAEVLTQPGIEIGPPPDWAPVDAALGRLEQYDWLVFSSGNGVRYMLDRLLATGGDLRRLGRVKLAAIGPGTAAELANYHLKADLVPAEYRAEVAGRGASAGRRRREVVFSWRGPTRAGRYCPSGWPPPAPRWTRWCLFDHGGDPGRRGGSGRVGGRPHRLGDGDQFGDSPLAGRVVRPLVGSESLGQHQPGHVGGASRFGLSAGGRGGRVHDVRPGRGDRGGEQPTRRSLLFRRA